jgi:hypothetical protein
MNFELKKLMIEEEFKTSGRVTDAVCKVQIYERDDAGFAVILSDPDKENYRGVSTTNNFENFATGIKGKYLNNVSDKAIKWFDRIHFKGQGFDPLLVKVDLSWSGSRYSKPNWKGAVAC